MRPRTCGNLPSELTGLVGRGRELAELARLLERSRLVTVTGVGGVGKSRLALRAARAVQERSCEPVGAAAPGAGAWPADGVWLAELSAVRDPELLVHALAEALRLTDHTTRPPRTVLAEHLADRELLLVLDGFEQLVDPCAELVRELLRHAPGLRVLAAGRRPLALDGE
ncbi:AAA family ATPase, partial [Streptomyces sp. 12297]